MFATLRHRTITVLAPVIILALAACSDAADKGADRPPANPLFYEIASADGMVEGWMVGTIHALPDGVRWKTPRIAEAINSADVLVVEIAALEDRDKTAATFAELGTSPAQPPLDSRIPATLSAPLAVLLDRGGIDLNHFASTETWAAAIMLAQIGATGDPANGVDRALIRDFAGRPVQELEGVRGQLAIFDRLPEASQRNMLAAVIREAEAGRDDPTRLQRAWLSGDAAVIEEATRTGILADPALREALLTGRNRDWVTAILPMLEAGPRPLIAVGTAHLVGADGLASLLQAQGYRVRRLP
ncbi:MAG TPA: TraB/GumN family protein [Erythrobacter sp.]|nr:TraB/GumN family protein [Erythrobacter sp.]